jgi:hypothetical protein
VSIGVGALLQLTPFQWRGPRPSFAAAAGERVRVDLDANQVAGIATGQPRKSASATAAGEVPSASNAGGYGHPQRHGLNLLWRVTAILGTPSGMDHGVRREETKIGLGQSAIRIPAPRGSEELNRIPGNVEIWKLASIGCLIIVSTGKGSSPKGS